MTRQGIIIALVVVVAGLLFLGASPLFVVDIIQNAIVVQLGKPVRNITEPGLYVKVPFIQEVTYFDKRLLDYDSQAQDVITQDKKTLLLDNYAKWRIVDPLKVYQNFQTQRGALQRLNDIIYSELRVELGRHDLLEIVADDFTTIAGFVIAQTGSVPRQGEQLKVRELEIEILDADEKRISRLRLSRTNDSKAEDATAH